MLLLAFSNSCSGEDTESPKDPETVQNCDEKTDTCPGNGWVALASGNTATIDFKNSGAGSEFIIMPFATGDTSTIEGANDETFDVKLSSSEPSGSKLYFSAPTSSNTAFLDDSWQFKDADRRFLAHHFRRDLGDDQLPGFWETAKRLDQSEASGFLTESPGPTERAYRTASKTKSSHRAYLTNLAASCPEAGDDVVVPDHNLNPVEVSVKAASDETDFCYVVVSDPVTEPNAEAIKASTKEVLRRYKSQAFYNDSFPSLGSYSFKPMIIIIAFDNPAVWPSAKENPAIPGQKLLPSLQGAGFFIGQMAADTGQPMLYMAADFTKVDRGPQTNDAVQRGIWHGTIAHEMQHAIINYYRDQQNKKPESATLDEGLAHFYEDLFGYGSERFSFPKSFLTTFPDGISPFFPTKNPSDSEVRGSVQCLLYYLASKKGGFTKGNDSYISGGDGLKFIHDVAKNTGYAGAVNLANKFGGNWTETIGDYLGALVFDGSKIENVADKYKVKDPISGVKDLSGGVNKTFGMHYNNFGEVNDRLADSNYQPLSDVPTIEGLSYYQTKPIKVTLSKKGQKLNVSWSGEIKGAAVSVIRIK